MLGNSLGAGAAVYGEVADRPLVGSLISSACSILTRASFSWLCHKTHTKFTHAAMKSHACRSPIWMIAHTTNPTCMHACIWASNSISSEVVFIRSNPIPVSKLSRLAMSTGSMQPMHLQFRGKMLREWISNICKTMSKNVPFFFSGKCHLKWALFFLRLFAAFCARIAFFCARIARHLWLRSFASHNFCAILRQSFSKSST